MTSIPWMDGVLVLIVLISCIAGFIRGFTREVLGLVSWGGSIYGALYLYPFLVPFIQNYIESPVVATLLSGLGIFCVLFFFLSLLSKGISTKVKGSILSGFDRTLGLIFGIARGWILLGFLFVGAAFLIPFAQWPQEVKQGKIIPISALSAQFILDSLPGSLPRLVSLKGYVQGAMVQMHKPLDMSVGTVSLLHPISLASSVNTELQDLS